MAEKEMKIVISARDGLTGPLDGFRAKTRSAVEDIASSLERLNSSRGVESFSLSAGRHLTSLGRAFAELKGSMDEVQLKGLGDTGVPDGQEARLRRLRDNGRLYLDERARLSLGERNIVEGHLRETEDVERVSWATRLMYAQTAASMLSNTMQNLFIATGSRHRAMFEAMKAFAIAETVIQTYRAAQGAYAALAPIPVVGPALGAAAAAAAVVAGLARVEQIRNTNPRGATSSISAGGRANPPYSGGSPGAYPVPARLEDAGPTQFITVQIYNPLSEQNWQRIVEDSIIPAMKEAGDRNISLSVRNMGS